MTGAGAMAAAVAYGLEMGPAPAISVGPAVRGRRDGFGLRLAAGFLPRRPVPDAMDPGIGLACVALPPFRPGDGQTPAGAYYRGSR
jgi:hypothetical protein